MPRVAAFLFLYVRVFNNATSRRPSTGGRGAIGLKPQTALLQIRVNFVAGSSRPEQRRDGRVYASIGSALEEGRLVAHPPVRPTDCFPRRQPRRPNLNTREG
jgi:hypothetical protein